ncbi:MAG: hydroxyacylglutathione hydrolase [Synechococcaceae cyanobacterium]|nr:hydroxyacylglutathione hydrolase [Synechococcaceae cyanobacterium]
MSPAPPAATGAQDPLAEAFALGPAGAEPAREIGRIPVLRDNYVFVLHDGTRAAVVDPAVAEPVIAWLRQRGLSLTAILQTHHHSDHIGGTPQLLQAWPEAAVVAARADLERIPFQTHGVSGGERFRLLGRPVQVLGVPGHTRAHLAYYLPPSPPAGGSDTEAQAQTGELFCGDTLFSAGCGRLFEGTAEQMHRSLQQLKALPAATRVWCAHEYTETNLRWASRQRPDDGALSARLLEVQAQRRRHEPTIPSSLAEERRTNLFLRARDAQELAELRASRNDWNG